MALLLTKSEVSDLLDMRKAIELTEQVYREQAEGRVEPWAPFVVGDEDRELRVNAGSVSGLEVAGLRAGMRGGAQLLLYDTSSGKLACILGYPFSYLRVGTTVGLAVDRLTRPGARRLTIVGTGRIALVSLEAIACLRKFERVEVFSREEKNRINFCSAARERFGVEAAPVENVEASVRAADAVVLATSADGAVLRGKWLSAGAHVSTAGIRCEIDDDAYLRAERVIVASKEQEKSFRAQTTDNVLLRLTTEGRLDWREISELGDIVGGRIGRPSGISVFRESQGGFGDLVLAKWIYQRAKDLGRGRTIDFNA